ncbi:MAG: glycine--tRNA ligase subunit beta, partial [Oligoflexia bacterium]|nr:glycine--tRNA ligase subunit beta [Oligoflexia bacterium]
MSANTHELFIAVRCEELPARFVKHAADHLAKRVLGLLSGIEYGSVQTWSTPRRIAVAVTELATGKP